MKKQTLIMSIIVVTLILTTFCLASYYKYQQNAPQRGKIDFGPDNCKPGNPCVMEEDEGKKKVSDTKEVQALAKKYGGWQHVHIGALDIDLVRHTAFIEKIYPNYAADTGCIIVVHAGDEGYVYREDKNLNIVLQETLPEFLERTQSIDSEVMSKFYFSLH